MTKFCRYCYLGYSKSDKLDRKTILKFRGVWVCRGCYPFIWEPNYCACGCGETTKKIYKSGHNFKNHHPCLEGCTCPRHFRPHRKTHSKETRRKISESLTGYKHSKEFGEQQSKLVKARFSDPEYIRKVARRRKHTSIEIILFEHLATLYHPDEIEIEFPIPPYTVDFAMQSNMVVCEADGYHWHNLPGAKERDAKRDEYLTNLGWMVVRFPESWLRERKKTLRIQSNPLLWEIKN